MKNKNVKEKFILYYIEMFYRYLLLKKIKLEISEIYEY